jgi:hypothetical protein
MARGTMFVSVHEGAMALMRIGSVGWSCGVSERRRPRTACLVVAVGVRRIFSSVEKEGGVVYCNL